MKYVAEGGLLVCAYLMGWWGNDIVHRNRRDRNSSYVEFHWNGGETPLRQGSTYQYIRLEKPTLCYVRGAEIVLDVPQPNENDLIARVLCITEKGDAK